MSDADWDAEDFEPQEAVQGSAVTTDKWDGEDEDPDVKDNWDDDDEEKPAKVAVEVKKKKSLKDRIAEKEEKRRKEAEAKKLQEEQARTDLTPEELAAEKLRQQKLQEDADFELAKGLVGANDVLKGDSIDTLSPCTKEDFNKFEELLTKKITQCESSPHYPTFLENLCRNLCTSCGSEDIKRIASTLNALANEKNKQQKGTKKKGSKTKANLKAGKSSNFDDYDAAPMDDFDDFI